MKKILEIKNLKVSLNTYAGKVKAVRGISFDLFQGETLVVVGESGCGKTIMSKSILRLLPEEIGVIEEGSQIIFKGKDILKMREKELQALRGEDISMIFQDPSTHLNPTMTIGDQIMESLIIHRNMNKEELKAETLNMIKKVKISNPEKRLKQYAHEFSGGMRQRTLIAIALACNPSILIADEPTTALDVTIQADILELIQDLQRELSTSVILITHDLGIAAEIADKIQVMYAGEIVESASKEEIFNNPRHPYTWALLRSVPALEYIGDKELYSLKGNPPDLLKDYEACPFYSRCDYAMNICEKMKAKPMKISEGHQVSCWLNHRMAPDVKTPVFLGRGR